MCKENHTKLWILKFCLKVIFPNYNLYFFLVYLAIKYRIYYHRQKHNKSNSMEIFKVCCIPSEIQKILIDESSEGTAVVESYSSSLVVPYSTYVRMATENPFYIDRTTVWAALHLSPTLREKFKSTKTRESKSLKYNLKQMKSEIHKKLWSNNKYEDYDRIRLVRIVGSKRVPQDIILVNEDEKSNIKNCFGFPFEEDAIELRLRPVESMDYVPQIATSAVVHMILNPFDLSNDLITELLSNYFRTPRLVHVDDIFSINLTKEMTTKYYYKYFDLIESTSKVYFKCCKINCGVVDIFTDAEDGGSCVQIPYFIVKGKTELNLGENVHSMTSAIRHYNIVQMNRHSTLVELCPYGLKPHFCKMQESILPFLANKQGNPIHTSPMTPIKPIFLLTGAVGSGRHLLVKTLAKYNGVNTLVMDCNAIQSTTAKQTESKINSLVQRAKTCSPVFVLVDNFEVFAVDAENNEDCRVLEYFRNITTNLFENYTIHPIIFIAISERADLKPNILRMFLDKFHLTKPNNTERQELLAWSVAAMQLSLNESANVEENSQTLESWSPYSSDVVLDPTCKEVLQRISAKTETFSCGDLDTLVHFALRNSFMNQCDRISDNITGETVLENLNEEDFSTALESMRALQSQHMDAPKIPKVYWEDIGGLDALKKELLKTIEFPIKYPHLFKNSSLKRSGILLYGPPGCGKTLVAKALSTELNISFLSVKGPELLNMYIGQSEENVRKVFEAARAASPCIVFLDELDALAPRRGATGDSGGASDRVVSQLLAEIDGVADSVDRAGGSESSSFVFIMGATNRPDLLEQSLLRPGRLDKLIYVGPYCGLQEKTRVLAALCHRKRLGEGVVLSEVADGLPERCTGADLLQVVSVARAAAVRRAVAALHSGVVKESELDSSSLVLETADLQEGVAAFKPSTTSEEFAYYERLRTQL